MKVLGFPFLTLCIKKHWKNVLYYLLSGTATTYDNITGTTGNYRSMTINLWLSSL